MSVKIIHSNTSSLLSLIRTNKASEEINKAVCCKKNIIAHLTGFVLQEMSRLRADLNCLSSQCFTIDLREISVFF